MNENYWKLKTVVDYLSNVEMQKVLDYCKRQFPNAYKRILTDEADSIKEIDAALQDVKNGKPFILKNILDAIEYDIIMRTLTQFKKQTRAAHFLGLKEQTLRYKMIRLNIPTVRDNQEYYIEKRMNDPGT